MCICFKTQQSTAQNSCGENPAIQFSPHRLLRPRTHRGILDEIKGVRTHTAASTPSDSEMGATSPSDREMDANGKCATQTRVHKHSLAKQYTCWRRRLLLTHHARARRTRRCALKAEDHTEDTIQDANGTLITDKLKHSPWLKDIIELFLPFHVFVDRADGDALQKYQRNIQSATKSAARIKHAVAPVQQLDDNYLVIKQRRRMRTLKS